MILIDGNLTCPLQQQLPMMSTAALPCCRRNHQLANFTRVQNSVSVSQLAFQFTAILFNFACLLGSANTFGSHYISLMVTTSDLSTVRYYVFELLSQQRLQH